VLYETIKQLESQRVRVPRALRSNFVLLHSYMLVKSLARREDHEGAARMLLRVAKNVSKFPSHVVPILTSTVVECQRAGLKNSAFQYASTLMRQEHRGKIDKNVRRQIEAIVRRPSRDEEPEALSECPISGIPIPVTQLECPTTKDALPMCVVTGRHMERGDWCICPVSGMPALLTAYKRYIEWTAANGERDHTVSSREGIDPVMGQPVSSSSLKRCTPEEIQEQIKAYNMSEAEEKEAQAADDEKTEASKGEKMQKPQPRSAY
jgi:WD repeat-containing protein 19